MNKNLFLVLCIAVFLVSTQCDKTPEYGLFEAHTDIGNVGQAGSVEYNADEKTYTVTGGGENMWFDSDAFHYLYREAGSDFSIAADITWIGTSGNPHRKAGLVIRQSLEPDAAYADVVVHGDGLTSIQYREKKGGPTREIQSNVLSPKRVELSKDGEYVHLSLAKEGEELHSAGGSFKIKFEQPFYVGLGVCAHDSTVLEQAAFSNVEIEVLRLKSTGDQAIESSLETIEIASKDRRVVFNTMEKLSAPIWSTDGAHILFRNDGEEGKTNHVTVSDGEQVMVDSLDYVSLKEDIQSYGNYIYYDSDESGTFQIWRRTEDGSSKEQLTFDSDHNNRAPRVSPNGKNLLYISYTKSKKNNEGQESEYKDAILKMIPANGGEPEILAKFLGGKEDTNFASWSPDGTRAAFVNYRVVRGE